MEGSGLWVALLQEVVHGLWSLPFRVAHPTLRSQGCCASLLSEAKAWRIVHSWVWGTRSSLLLACHWPGLSHMTAPHFQGGWDLYVLAECPRRRGSRSGEQLANLCYFIPPQLVFFFWKKQTSPFSLILILFQKPYSTLYRKIITQTNIFWGGLCSWFDLHDSHLVKVAQFDSLLTLGGSQVRWELSQLCLFEHCLSSL